MVEFDNIVKQYRNPLFFMIYSMVNNLCDAEDLTQVTFMKAYEGKFTPDYKFSTWLFKIGRNTTLDFIKHKSYIPCNFKELDYNMRLDCLNPEQELINKDQISKIEKAIEQLESPYKEIINLRSEGYQYNEIAEIMNLSMGIIQSYLHRGRKKLKKLLS